MIQSQNSKFSLFRNSTVPIIIPRTLNKKKQSRPLELHSSDEERQEVEKLSEWEKRESKPELISIISEAKNTLKKRIDGEDLVEEIKFKRKHRNKSHLPALSSKIILPAIKTINQRKIQKEAEETFKERCRHFRNFEEDLKNTYNELTFLLEKIKSDRENIREECVEIRKNSTLFIDSIEVLKEKLAKFENKGRAKLTQEELAVWMNKRDNMREEIKQKELQKVEILNKAKEETEIQGNLLRELDEKNKNIRKKIEIVKSTQKHHYLKLLKEGKDIRNEGIQWLVISLWKLGETVSVDDFPPFLDQEAVHFILFTAQKNLEIEEILDKIINPAKRSSDTLEKNQDRWNNIKERLLSMTKQMSSNKPEYVYSNYNKKMSIRWVPCSNVSEAYSKNTSEPGFYENYVTKLKDLIKIATENEIQRLTIECSLHSYEERFKINIKDLICAIAGTESLDKYLAQASKHKRTIKGMIDGSRNYNLNLG